MSFPLSFLPNLFLAKLENGACHTWAHVIIVCYIHVVHIEAYNSLLLILPKSNFIPQQKRLRFQYCGQQINKMKNTVK